MTQARRSVREEHLGRSEPMQQFADDMLDFFGGWRAGHIARHGYVGRGGVAYAQWLLTNQSYRSRVTQAEIECLTAHADVLAEICDGVSHFVEAGVGSYRAFLMKTHALLAQLVARNAALRYTIADVSRLSYDDVAGQTAKLRLPTPDFHEGNFFTSLPALVKGAVVYMPGLTFTNIPADAIKEETVDLLARSLAFFAKSLHRGGTLIFTYATNDGVDSQGTELKALYDDALIHDYQQSIFDRVSNELDVAEGYHPDFSIHHVWRPEKFVLTRHAILHHPLDFTLEGQKFVLEPANFDGYMANNFRPSDELMGQAVRSAGFTTANIFSLPHSNIRVMAAQV